jgi:nicotinamide mononucleotide adenylyltransferase
VAGYFSPVGDSYKKAGLAPAYHRVRMLDLACETEERIMVDRYEALQSEYVRTAEVLDHFEEQLNRIGGGVEDVEGNKVSIKIALLVGADLLHTMGVCETRHRPR